MDVTQIQEMLDASDLETRLIAVKQLVQAKEAPSDTLRKAMEDEAIPVREHAILAASRLFPIEELISLLGEHANATLRNAAIEALKKAGKRGANALVPALSHPDPEVVMFVTQILGDIDARVPEDPLIGLLSHEDKNIAQASIETLGKRRAKKAVPALLEVLENDFWLQFAAINALGEIADPQAISSLISRLGDDMYRGEAAEALGKIGDPQAIVSLLELWKSETWPPLRARVTLAIARIVSEHPKALQLIEERLTGDEASLLRTLLMARPVAPEASAPKNGE